jgi:3'(2'), 5'-bisphosphate nucleotidase
LKQLNLSSHINEILEIAFKASEAIMNIYNIDFSIVHKEDNSPLTQADELSNNIITESLEKIFPSIPILSEESKEVDYSIRKNWELFWLVDPLDGTKEFIKKNNEFCINIALVKNNIPVFGLIHHPVSNTSFYNLGNKIFKHQKHSEIITEEIEFSKTVNIISSSSHHNPILLNLINKINQLGFITTSIQQGSALKFCSLVNNQSHIYPRYGPTMEWDTAAGHALLDAAGGSLIDMITKKPLIYNKGNLKNNNFIALSKSANHLFADSMDF